MDDITALLSGEPHDIGKVKEVRENFITRDNGWSFVWSDQSGPMPEVGDEVITIGSIGRPIRGVVVNGELRWYQTEDQWRDEFDEMQREKERKDRVALLRTLPDWLKRYNALPLVFQERINKFVAERDDWIRQFGAYELMCCEDAVKVAKWIWRDGTLHTIQKLKDDWEIGKEIGMDPGHSGNSFSVAIGLGELYANEDFDAIRNSHGALVALVGCEEYGCPHPK